MGDTVAEALSEVPFRTSADPEVMIPANMESSKQSDQRKTVIIRRIEELIREQQQLLEELRSL